MMSLKKKLFLAAALIATGTLVALIFVTPRATPEEPLPNPNGYDDFVQAAALINGNTPDWTNISADGWRSLVATNQPVLEQVRAGLQKQCRVVPYDLTVSNSNHFNDLPAFKRTAQAFAAASKLAVTDGNTNEAAMLALDCIRFGHESARGGVLIDGLVGLAIQSIGRARLEEALPGVDADTSQKIVAGLEDVADRWVQPDEIWKREGQWARRGRFGRYNPITVLIGPFLQRDVKKKTDQRFTKAFGELQQTKLRAAARTYELDHGKQPAAARDLVPQYLKSIPLNLTNGTEMQLN